MFHVCENCGEYRADKIIDPSGPFAVCPECGHTHRFRWLPLLVVGGASGSGKSTVCSGLVGRFQDAVLLDADILWRPEFNRPEDGYRDFFDLWLRLAMNIAQSGRPAVLFGAGVGVPENLEGSVERRYFSAIHYLALVCTDEALAQRLQQRPAWRESGGKAFIEENQKFNRWFRRYRSADEEPGITLIDTSDHSPMQTISEVEVWMRQILQMV